MVDFESVVNHCPVVEANTSLLRHLHLIFAQM